MAEGSKTVTPKQIAEVGVSRLGLPIPMVKLMTIQAIAQALADESLKETFASAAIEWIAERELESECLEMLCCLLVARPDPDLLNRFRQAIRRPSIASDMMLSLAAASALPPAWSGCHSGPAPERMQLDIEELDLCSGTFIPPLFTQELQALQRTFGFPLIRQWSFEYKILNERCHNNSDGHLSYFCGQERENEGQFVARRSHLARSAFLRVLAYAVEQWKMPAHLARHFASLALPSEPIFLKLSPQDPPSWAFSVQRRPATEIADAQAMVSGLLRRIEDEGQRRTMHCSLTVVDTPLIHVDLEVFAIARTHEDVEPQSVINFYQYLVGKFTPLRDKMRAFISPEIESDIARELCFAPIVLPLIGPHLGYLQSDLVVRTPYIPISTRNVFALELVTDLNGAALHLDGEKVGEWFWWLWNWNPTHPKDWLTPIGCHTCLTSAVAEQIAVDAGGPIEQVWKLTIWERKKNYEEWRSRTEFGRVRP